MDSFIRIRDLSRIIRKFGNKSSKALFQPNQKYSQVRSLAQKFGSEIPRNERAWASEICGTGEHDQTYIRLRSQLKRLLVSRLAHLEIHTGTEWRKAVYRNAREVFFIRMLVMFGARSMAMWLIPRAMARARKFELTGDRIELLLLLRQNATINGYKKKFARYVRELANLEKLRSAEQRMRAMNDEINVEVVLTVSPSDRAIALAKAALPEAGRIFEEFSTFNIGFDYYRIATLAAEIQEDHVGLLRLCNQSQRFLGTFPHMVTPLSEGQFALKRFRAAVATHDFESANLAIPDCERLFPEGNNNWFIWKEVELLLRLHEEEHDFSNATALHHAMVGHHRFASQPEQAKQRWAFYGYYAAFAAWHEDPSRPLPITHFEKVLDSVPNFKRDKAGYNASLLILQQLLYASTGDKDAASNRAIYLRRYIARYLSKRRHTQLYAFLKMLLLLQKCEFNVARAEKRGKRYKIQFSTYGHEEVDEKQSLPFPQMWEWIAANYS